MLDCDYGDCNYGDCDYGYCYYGDCTGLSLCWTLYVVTVLIVGL